MKVIISAAVSLDGCLDDCSPGRLILSSPEDWREVYRLRASCDAILVGAGTLRADNPSLSIKDPALRKEREDRGQPADILRVTLSRKGEVDASLKFFTGSGRPVVFSEGPAEGLREIAEVVACQQITARSILDNLSGRGVQRLLVEGGRQVLEMFFREGLVDEFRLAIAPFFVGDPEAPRLTGVKSGRMVLQSVERLGDTSVMHLLNPRDHYLDMAIEESRKCAPSATAYSVGAVVVPKDGRYYTGYTHETSPLNHAEEEAIQKALDAGADLCGATIYASMEPCSKRASKSKSCSQLIVEHGFSRVVFALREPECFVKCEGESLLRSHGIEVVEAAGLGDKVKEINKHIICRSNP